MGTYLAKASRGQISWNVVDAEGWVLGRLAARAAQVLVGKNMPDFSPAGAPIDRSATSLVGILKDSNYRAKESAWGDCPVWGWVDPTYTFNRFTKRSRHRFLGSIP